MGRAGRCVGLAAAVLLLTGCGVDVPSTDGEFTTPPGHDATSASPGAAGTGTPTTGDATADAGAGPEYGPQFPLTLRRTGGVAGFDDRIVLRADGKLLVDTRSVHGRVCTLGGAQLHQIVGALSTLRLGPWSIGTTPTDGAGDGATDPASIPASDPIIISVTDDRSRAVDLTDPSVGEVAGLVATLVADVTLSAPATTRCTDAAAS
ncbi:hypothetical protein [Intrasporangium sp. YIM S08009]|uniref:hypothetical protein n=1 Tax=Intrasporangium zincisolvens TaxID=3080018 RepID=UPI002B052121|nr:hypothetical protein [Intrasporangium sp. YIM S08009]